MYTIKKIFKFEMAHWLTNSYSQECQRVHGHSYKLEVHISREKLNDQGMVIDFKRLKEVVQPLVNKFDHMCIGQMPKEGASVPFDTLKKMGVVLVDYNPTAENMVKYFYDQIKKSLFSFGIQGLKVSLWETETGCVSYEKEWVMD